MRRTERPSKAVPAAGDPHSPKCQRDRYSTGYDWGSCGRCSVEAALELVRLRAFRLRHEVLR